MAIGLRADAAPGNSAKAKGLGAPRDGEERLGQSFRQARERVLEGEVTVEATALPAVG